MRKIIIFQLLTILCFTLSSMAYGGEKDTSWDLAVGPGLNIDGINTKQLLIAPALSMKVPNHELLRYRFEGDLELIDSNGAITAVIGVAPFLRFLMSQKESRPFLEAGAGVNLISRNHTAQKDSGGIFQFTLMGGAGYEFSSSGKPISISCRFRHISNSHIYEENQSINTLYLLVSFGI